MNFLRVLIFLTIGLVQMTFVSPLFAANPALDSTPFKDKPTITFETLPNGVSVRKIVFKSDPRLIVPANRLVTFRVYVRDNTVIAMSWSNLYLTAAPDPLKIMTDVLPKVLKSMGKSLEQLPNYRFIAVMDVKEDKTVSGVFYSPTFFPRGMNSGDLKW